MPLSLFQANGVAGQTNDYPIKIINRLFFSSFKNQEEGREKHVVLVSKKGEGRSFKRYDALMLIQKTTVATTNDEFIRSNSDSRKLSSIPSLIFFIDQSYLSYFPCGGIA